MGKNRFSSAALPPALRKGSAFPAGRNKTDILSFLSGKAEPFRKAGGRAAPVKVVSFTASIGERAPAKAQDTRKTATVQTTRCLIARLAL